MRIPSPRMLRKLRQLDYELGIVFPKFRKGNRLAETIQNI